MTPIPALSPIQTIDFANPNKPLSTPNKKAVPLTKAGSLFTSLKDSLAKFASEALSKEFTASLVATPVNKLRHLAHSCLGICVKKIEEPSLPKDPSVICKKLDNGLTYYVKEHNYPFPQHACLRLIVRTGFLDEKPEERGIAHLVEHIAQKETALFAKNEIEKYLSSKGIAWGQDKNALTNCTETVYQLDIPLDDPEILEKALLIFSQTAFHAQLSDETIDRERSVVIDELKQRSQDIAHRYQQKMRSVLLDGTPYATASVDLESHIKNVQECPNQIVRDYYKRWYKPENTAVVAVGDFDAAQVEELIKKHFGIAASSQKPAPYHNHIPTAHKETRFVCFSDPEASQEIFEVYFKLPHIQENNDIAYLKNIKYTMVNQLFTEMLDFRLEELEYEENHPLLYASGSRTTVIPNCPYFHLVGIPKEGKLAAGVKQLLLEVKRIKEHGFLPVEFEKAKERLIAKLDHYLLEKNNLSAKTLTKLYQHNFTEQSPMPNAQALLEAKRKLVDDITLSEINAWASHMTPENNRVISTLTAQKPLSSESIEKDLKDAVEEVKTSSLKPYKYVSIDRPLISQLPEPGKIAEIKKHKTTNVTEYILENGLKVYVKPTTFNSDVVSILGYSVHGTRDAPLKDRVSAKFADDFFDACGIGEFDFLSLRKVLNNKHLNFKARVGTYLTKVSTSCVKKDMETAFQLFHLMFTNPGYNKVSFDKAYKEVEEYLRNRDLNPDYVLVDEILAANTQDHPEFRPIKLKDLEQVDYETTKNFHQKAFGNPADFKVIIVGNLEDQEVKSYIERYMASLAKTGKMRVPTAHSPVPFPPGITRKEVYAGKDSACVSYFSFPSPISDTYQERILSVWSSVLVQKRLQEVLRKQMGKTYCPECEFINTAVPNLNPHNPSKTLITLSFDPQHQKELEEALFKEIRHMQAEGPTLAEIADFKTNAKLEFLKFFKTNAGWLESLFAKTLWEREIDQMDEFDQVLQTLTPQLVANHLKKILPLDNYCVVTHFPKKEDKLMEKTASREKTKMKD